MNQTLQAHSILQDMGIYIIVVHPSVPLKNTWQMTEMWNNQSITATQRAVGLQR